jgi:hypothetical protein
VLLLARPSSAEPPPPDPARLGFELPAAFGSCPSESYFRNFVAARFGGTDPFTDTAPRRIEVKVRRDKGAGFRVELVMLDAAGKRLGDDALSEPTCVRAVEAAGNRVVSWLFPIVGPAPDPTGAPPPAPAPPPPPPKPPPVPPEPVVVSAAPPDEPVRPRFVPRLGVGARADFGTSWGAIFGVTLEGGVQRREWGWGGWSLMGALRWAPQQTGIGPPTSVRSFDVSSSLVAGRLAGCVYRAWAVSLAGCVVGELGEVQQSAGTLEDPNQHQTVLFAGGGVGAHIQVPLTARVHVQMETDVLGVARLAGTTSQVNNVLGRSFGGAAGGIGASLGVSF